MARTPESVRPMCFAQESCHRPSAAHTARPPPLSPLPPCNPPPPDAPLQYGTPVCPRILRHKGMRMWETVIPIARPSLPLDVDVCPPLTL